MKGKGEEKEKGKRERKTERKTKKTRRKKGRERERKKENKERKKERERWDAIYFGVFPIPSLGETVLDRQLISFVGKCSFAALGKL